MKHGFAQDDANK